jgi:hypothetical protein
LKGAALDPLNDRLNARRIKARPIERCGKLLKETLAAANQHRVSAGGAT